jgi:hypothetical protein
MFTDLQLERLGNIGLLAVFAGMPCMYGLKYELSKLRCCGKGVIPEATRAT